MTEDDRTDDQPNEQAATQERHEAEVERSRARDERKRAADARAIELAERDRITVAEAQTAITLQRIDDRTSDTADRTERIELAIFGIPDPDGRRDGGMLARLNALERRAIQIGLLILASFVGALCSAVVTLIVQQ